MAEAFRWRGVLCTSIRAVQDSVKLVDYSDSYTLNDAHCNISLCVWHCNMMYSG